MSRAVLALDLATTTGWALHNQGMQRPFFGSFTLKADPDEPGPALSALWDFLDEQHMMHGLETVVKEAAHVGRPGKVDPLSGKTKFGVNPKTVKYLHMLAGTVELWCFRNVVRGSNSRKVKCWDAHIATWRKHFLGKPPGGGIWKKRDVKQAAIAAAATLGFHTDIADAAEACGILDYFLSLDRSYDRPWRDNALLGGRLL